MSKRLAPCLWFLFSRGKRIGPPRQGEGVTWLVVLIGGVGACVDWWGGTVGRIRVTQETHSQTPLAEVVPSNQQVLTNLQVGGSCGATKTGPKVPGREGVCIICRRRRRQRGGQHVRVRAGGVDLHGSDRGRYAIIGRYVAVER